MSWAIISIIFAISALLTIAATGLCLGAAIHFGIMNQPNRNVPQHTTAVAYLGGVGVALGGITSLLLLQAFIPLRLLAFEQRPHLPIAFLVGAALFLLLGLVDDFLTLSPMPKLILQIVAAAVAALFGINPYHSGHAFLGFALSCGWIVLLVNAANVTDVCDGLLAGLSLVAFSFFGFFGSDHRFIAMALMGACFGFLAFNRPPARIFLGDAGSHLLGFTLAFFTLSEVAAHSRISTFAAMLLVTAVPLFEVSFLTAIRTRQKIPFWKGSPDHFALRLQAAGLSQGQTDLIACSFMALFCGIAWVLLHDPPWQRQVILIATTILILTGCWLLLLRFEVPVKCAVGRVTGTR